MLLIILKTWKTNFIEDIELEFIALWNDYKTSKYIRIKIVRHFRIIEIN